MCIAQLTNDKPWAAPVAHGGAHCHKLSFKRSGAFSDFNAHRSRTSSAFARFGKSPDLNLWSKIFYTNPARWQWQWKSSVDFSGRRRNTRRTHGDRARPCRGRESRARRATRACRKTISSSEQEARDDIDADTR